MNRFVWVFIGASFFLVSACGGGRGGMSAANVRPSPAPVSVHTKVTKDFAYAGAPMKKILVIGVFVDPQLKRTVEDGFANRLQSAGSAAISAYKILPQDELLTKELIQSTVADTDIDGVIVARLKKAGAVQTETLRANAPSDGGGIAGRVSDSGSDFYGHYSSVYQNSREPGFAVDALQYEIEVKLFEVIDGKSIWQAAQTVENPQTRSAVIDQVAKMTAENLLNEGIIGASTSETNAVAPQ